MTDTHADTHGGLPTPTGAMHPDGMEHAPGEVEHGSRKTYVVIGVILTVITAAEVWVYSIESLKDILIPLLLVLSAVKFVLVVRFFMHLKYDDKVFSRVFFGPMFLAVLVVIGMIMLFKVLPRFDW